MVKSEMDLGNRSIEMHICSDFDYAFDLSEPVYHFIQSCLPYFFGVQFPRLFSVPEVINPGQLLTIARYLWVVSSHRTITREKLLLKLKKNSPNITNLLKAFATDLFPATVAKSGKKEKKSRPPSFLHSLSLHIKKGTFLPTSSNT